jgi:hypothetical protein
MIVRTDTVPPHALQSPVRKTNDNDTISGTVISALNLYRLYNKRLRAACSRSPFRSVAFLTHQSSLLLSIMGLAGVLSVFVSKKQEKPWEVVDSKAVEPVSLYEEEDGACDPG